VLDLLIENEDRWCIDEFVEITSGVTALGMPDILFQSQVLANKLIFSISINIPSRRGGNTTTETIRFDETNCNVFKNLQCLHFNDKLLLMLKSENYSSVLYPPTSVWRRERFSLE